MSNMKIDMELHEKMFRKCFTNNLYKAIYPELCSTAHILELYNEEKFDNSTNNSHQK